jgi:hypothetical protein
MNLISGLVIAVSAWTQTADAQTYHSPETKPSPQGAAAAPSTAPKTTSSEKLYYNVNWPSGLSLGEGQMTAILQDGKWSFSFLMEAAVPGFAIREGAKASATTDYCSIELEKNATRGPRTVDETTTFDQKNLTASRQTNKGGKSELKIPGCAKDALTYIFFLRRELAAGRLPPAQSVYYGSAYQVRTQYVGTQTLLVRGEPTETDRVTAAIKGPASNVTIDLFFSRDEKRTPVLIQAPLAIGKFSLELAR